MRDEFSFLADLLARLGRRPGLPAVRLGPGDDAAVLRPPAGAHLVWSTDLLVEDVDFRRAWATPEDLGCKAAAANLSDLAAMGARPLGLLAALALPARTPTDWARRLLLAVDACGRRHAAPLVGGDLSATAGPVVLSISALGSVAPGAALRRGGGRAGEAVWVSGTLGRAAAGLCGLERLGPRRTPAALRQAQLRPLPRLRLGEALRRSGWVRACVDVSDGLAQDAERLAPPGHTVRLDLAAIPCLQGIPRRQALAWALRGGEDFELAFCAPPAASAALQALGRRLRLRLTRIGTVVPDAGGRRASPPGYRHFGAPARHRRASP